MKPETIRQIDAALAALSTAPDRLALARGALRKADTSVLSADQRAHVLRAVAYLVAWLEPDGAAPPEASTVRLRLRLEDGRVVSVPGDMRNIHGARLADRDPGSEVRVLGTGGVPPWRLSEDVRALLTSGSLCGVILAREGSAEPKAPELTDDDVAREFFRRFRPAKVLVGRWGDLVAYAETDDADAAGDWLSGRSAESEDVEEHAAGEAGFVAAVMRARELVRRAGR